jgi:hypothetical protein
MQMNETVQSAALLIAVELARTVERLENGVEEISQDELFNTLVELGELKYAVRTSETRLNILLTEHMRMNGDKILEYGSLIAERKFSSSRKNWEHGVLLEAVVNKVLSRESGMVVDPTTGEVVDLTNIAKPLIDAVVDNITKAAAIREWRVTALRALLPGLNPDDFCEVEKAERVSIRKKYS